MTIDRTQALSQFVGSIPTFTAVLIAWMNSNNRISDQNVRISDLRADMKEMRADIKEMKTDLQNQLHRVEEVLDAGRSTWKNANFSTTDSQYLTH